MRSLYGKVFVKSLLSEKKAFTLAEVLVTLGIIGVVSAMTVPTLMQNHQRKTYAVQLHKVYNQIQQAALQYMTDKNALNLREAGLTSEDAGANFIKNYFKTIQDCGENQTPCFAETGEYRKLSGSKVTTWYGKRHFVLADGSSIATFYRSVSADPTVTTAVLEVWVDTNGQKGPNIVGRDLFVMYLYNGGQLDELDVTSAAVSEDDTEVKATIPMSPEQREKRFKNYCQSDSGANYHGCFGKLLNDNWEMNY